MTLSVGVEKGDCAKLLQLPGGQHVTGLNTTQGGKSGGRRKIEVKAQCIACMMATKANAADTYCRYTL